MPWIETKINPQIVTRDGTSLGEHTGLANYTIGQRKGLGVASAVPLYVLGKNAITNTLVVGIQEELGSDELTARDVNWLSGGLGAGYTFRWWQGQGPV